MAGSRGVKGSTEKYIDNGFQPFLSKTKRLKLYVEYKEIVRCLRSSVFVTGRCVIESFAIT